MAILIQYNITLPDLNTILILFPLTVLMHCRGVDKSSPPSSHDEWISLVQEQLKSPRSRATPLARHTLGTRLETDPVISVKEDEGLPVTNEPLPKQEL